MKYKCAWLLWPLGIALAVSGCKGVATQGELAARQDLRAVTRQWRPGGQPPALPALTPSAGLSNYLQYAMLNQPRVAQAYFEWAASVERITTARSLPDPQLTFEFDIQDVVTSVMPGLMATLPGSGKLKAGADVATAESESRYHAFESQVLQTAFDLKKAYYELLFLDARLDVNRRTLSLLGDLEKLARSQNEVGKVTLQDVLRAQIEQDQLTTETENLADSRNTLLARFKAALGLTADAAVPPIPTAFETTPLDLSSDKLFAQALARNPRLKALEAEVRQADAAITLAQKGRIPDFTVGLEADAKAAPILVRPQATMTLPIWKDKIAAQIAEAEAMHHAAAARLSAEQIDLAVDFAEKSYVYRQDTRTLALLQERLLPKATQALDVSRTAYLSGQTDFLNVIDAERTLLGFQMMEVEARAEREITLAELSLLILGTPPPQAPLLPVAPVSKP